MMLYYVLCSMTLWVPFAPQALAGRAAPRHAALSEVPAGFTGLS